MVALDRLEIVQQDTEQSLGIKKSKKKKNKSPEDKTVIDSSIETAKISAMKEMDSQVENLTKKKSHHKEKESVNTDNLSNGGANNQNSDEEKRKKNKEKNKKRKELKRLKKEKRMKTVDTDNLSNGGADKHNPDDEEKRKKKKEKRKRIKKEKRMKNGENMMETENVNDNEPKADKAQKRKHTEEVQNSHEKIGIPEQNDLQPETKKHKKSPNNEIDSENCNEKRTKKKSKKSKQEKTNTDDSASSNNSVSDQEIGKSDKEVKSDFGIEDIDATKKKKKKEKKAKKDVENGNSGTHQIGIDPLVGSDVSSKSEVDTGKFKKDFYTNSYTSVAHDHEKEKADAEKYRQDERITMYGKGKAEGQFHPIRDFKKLGFEENLLTAVKNFKEPTPIQAAAWPVIASGRDSIGIAETGSGKTLAFSIPALAHMKHRISKEQEKKNIKRRGPMMLVVAPTRELAQQSQDVLEDAGKKCGIRSVSVYGGVSKDSQRRALRASGAVPFEVVVATPGRLIDLMNEGTCDLSDVSYLVLDEADRMLDQGFERDVRKIIGATHPERQTCLFSATWPDTVRELAHEFLQNPIKITIGSDDLTAGSTIEQIVEVFDDDRQRQGRLLELLKNHKKSGVSTDKADKIKRVLIFVLYKMEATRIEEFLQGKGWTVTSIQGNKSQDARQKAVDNFKSGAIPLLVATDVAARGLDIPGVDLVINFSFPLTIEDYVHRIGRTGRAGKKGLAHTFFQTRADKLRAGELVKVLRDAGQPVPEKMLTFDLSIRKKEHKLYGAFGPKDSNVPMKQASKIVFGDD